MTLAPDFRATSSRRFVLLAPASADVSQFRQVAIDSTRHGALLARAQELRGRIYEKDGAIRREQLCRGGRHVQQADSRAWHLLTLEGRSVSGCARFLPYDNNVTFPQLGISQSALAHSPQWSDALRRAAEQEMADAAQRGLICAEVGGWALAETLRGTTEAVRAVLTVYALGQALGGTVALSTVTRRHCSSYILRRMGGRSLAWGGSELPSYFDAQYGCEMEILRFDSSSPNPKYRSRIEECREFLSLVPVVRAAAEPVLSPERAASRVMAGGFLGQTASYARHAAPLPA